MKPLAISLMAKRADLLGWGMEKRYVESPNTEVVTSVIEDRIQALKANPSPIEAWQMLQIIFGALPGHNLLRGFLRRITTLSPDATLAWLVKMLAASATPPLPNRCSLVAGAICVTGDATWMNESAALIRREANEREALLLAQPKIFLDSLNLSNQQSSALFAFGLIPQQEIWLMADDLFFAGDHTWPTRRESAYQRFMQWRVVSVAKGMVGSNQEAFESLRKIRHLYQSQGVEPLIEQIPGPITVSTASDVNV